MLQTRLHRYVYICILANRPGISGIVPDLASRCAGNIQNFSRNWVLSKLKTKADYTFGSKLYVAMLHAAPFALVITSYIINDNGKRLARLD